MKILDNIPKHNPSNHVFLFFIFKNENGTWKYAWMQRSQGTTDMKTWE